MIHLYDDYGWYTTNPVFANRSTKIAPPTTADPVVGEPYPNWTGYEWKSIPYVEPPEYVPPTYPEPVPPPPPVYQWYIDKGPFFDRFGSQKMPVLLSQDATIKALLADINNRHWIDLSRQDVVDAVNYIGTVIPGVDSNLRLAILTTPVAPEENLALRKLYFNGQ